MDQYKFGDFLGSGSYGVVYEATDLLLNKPVAIKRVTLEKEEIDQKLLREMSIQIELNHPNIVRLERVFVHQGTLNLVMEYFRTDLCSFLTNLDRAPSLSNIKTCLRRLISGISYLHSAGIIHRDLKPENVLMNILTDSKIADFGLARIIPPLEIPLTPQVVTLNYRAPELLLGSSEYSKAIDMWSLGCIFAEIVMNAAKKLEATEDETDMDETDEDAEDEIDMDDADDEIDMDDADDETDETVETDDTTETDEELLRIFKGVSEAQVLDCILRILGTPTEDTWPGVSLLHADIPHYDPQGLASVVPTLDPVGLDLLSGLLCMDPSQRLSAELALKHHFFDDI